MKNLFWILRCLERHLLHEHWITSGLLISHHDHEVRLNNKLEKVFDLIGDGVTNSGSALVKMSEDFHEEVTKTLGGKKKKYLSLQTSKR